MRFASPLAAAAVVIAAVAVLQQGALAQTTTGTIVWSTSSPGAFFGSMISSQVYVPDANTVYFNVLQRVSSATKDGYWPHTCFYSQTSKVTLCAKGSGGSTFELAPAAAGPSSLANLTNDAVSISTRATAATTGSSDVFFLSAATQQVDSATFLNASFEAAVPYFNQGEILARWTDIGNASTFIARFAISSNALKVTWINSYPHQQDSRLAPSGATNVFAYEDFTFFIVQDTKNAYLYKVDASDPDPFDNLYFALLNPCGLVPANDSLVHFRIAPYDIFNNSQVLSAMLLWGKMANGVPAICRVSHRYGTPNWNISGSALTFPTIDKILTLSLGAGIAVVTGSSATDRTKNLLFAFDARTGQMLWTDSRAASDAGSVPTVDQYTQQVYYQKNGNLVFAIATSGVARTTPKTGGCVLPPVVTPRRVYCVNPGHRRIVAYSPLSDDIIFNWTTAAAAIAFPPVVVPNDPGTFVIALDDGTVMQVTSNLPTPPPGPTTTNKPTGPTPKPGPTPTGGNAGPDPDDNKKNIIIAAVVIPVGVLFGGGIAFFLIRKRSSARRVARPEDIEAAINADDNLYNAA